MNEVARSILTKNFLNELSAHRGIYFILSSDCLFNICLICLYNRIDNYEMYFLSTPFFFSGKTFSHGLSNESMEDTHVHQSNALKSLPPELCLCVSSIPGAKFGVCTRKHIPGGTWIGPFVGKRVRPDELAPGTDTSQMWEVSSSPLYVSPLFFVVPTKNP